MPADLRADHEIIDQDKSTASFQQATAFSTDLKQLFATNNSSTQKSLNSIPANHRKDNNFKKYLDWALQCLLRKAYILYLLRHFCPTSFLFKNLQLFYTHKSQKLSPFNTKQSVQANILCPVMLPFCLGTQHVHLCHYYHCQGNTRAPCN